MPTQSEFDSLAADKADLLRVLGVADARVKALEAALREALDSGRLDSDEDKFKRLNKVAYASETSPNYNIPPWHLSQQVPGCRCDGCRSLAAETKGEQT